MVTFLDPAWDSDIVRALDSARRADDDHVADGCGQDRFANSDRQYLMA
jgi:hypothetical protein